MPSMNDQNAAEQDAAARGMRIEVDAMGAMEVPAEALYGAQTQRAVLNFPISGQAMPMGFVRALLQIKAAAAEANGALHRIDTACAAAIMQSCQALLGLEDALLVRHFPVDVFQTGSGTSSHMNANEVLASLASRQLGRPVHPLDQVNAGQSSNDVVPSSIHVATVLETRQRLLPALDHLLQVLQRKASSVQGHVKTGRTHLMDAMPVRLSQTLDGWAAQLLSAGSHVRASLPLMQDLALGGTAVGTGVNAHPEFAARCCQALCGRVGVDFRPAANPFALMGGQEPAVAVSGSLKVLAIALAKMANDLRWMNSGPLAGLAEIELPALQPGSSIMPGKVNPVIPEAALMVSAQVAANDLAVSLAGQSGNFELNVMLPLIARNLLESIRLMAGVMPLLADHALAGFKVLEPRLRESLARSPVLATALSPMIGYARAAEIARKSFEEGRPVLEVAAESTDIPRARLEELLDPARLTGAE